jgi:predicted HicB family RNase H-like nuclease
MSYVVGAPINLPEYITTTNIPIVSLNDVKNNMCFFAACAIALGARRDRVVYIIFGVDKSKAEVESLVRNYKGFDYVSELDAFEEKFTHAIEIVDYKADKLIELIRKSKFTDRVSIYLNLYENHFSGISNIKKLSGNFICKSCGSKFEGSAHLKKHSCIDKATDLFVKEGKSIWNKPRNVIIDACDFYEVSEIDFKHDYIVVLQAKTLQFILSCNSHEVKSVKRQKSNCRAFQTTC